MKMIDSSLPSWRFKWDKHEAPDSFRQTLNECWLWFPLDAGCCSDCSLLGSSAEKWEFTAFVAREKWHWVSVLSPTSLWDSGRSPCLWVSFLPHEIGIEIESISMVGVRIKMMSLCKVLHLCLSLPNYQVNDSSDIFLPPLSVTPIHPSIKKHLLTFYYGSDPMLVARDTKINNTGVLPSENL